MKLFKDITIVEKLTRFEIPDFHEKIAIIKKWHNDYHHGTLKTDKETSREAGYNQDFFSNILGFTRKPAEQANFDPQYSLQGKFPDGVLGYFHTDTEKSDNVGAVIELKGAGIPLDQPQKREKNYTPIEQGFGYKRLLRNCPFVIVSNFYELRLYNDNEIDYEVWNLDDLLDEADDYFNFRKFYYLLCVENLITETGTSKTESLLSEIRLEEQVITKKFYADYKSKRHMLLQNLYQKNETLRNDPDLLIEMGQKLIDRVIFMCFAEDRGLLPADVLQTIKKDSEKTSSINKWQALKIAFENVDNGSDAWGIPGGYNGGLFKNDEQFNILKVDDHVLVKIIDLGTYDFADQLSVTILGHIFEQSISDLEEIKEQIVESTNAGLGDITEPKTSKRKKDGIFYTPEYIVDYIVKNSLGAYLREHETKLIDAENLHDELSEREYQKREQVVYTKYQQFLSNVKVLDPACGSGAFLVRVFDYLLEDNRRVGKILGGMFNTDEMYKSILQNNIYGVDLNAESVEITKLSLWLKSAQKGKKLSNLDNNIKCGNSLIDDPAVAGDKAFNWETEFPFCHSGLDPESRGFDVIVGNPPYIKEYTNKKAFDGLHINPCYQGKMDLWYFFGSLALDLIKPETGKIGYIAPNNWITNAGASKFRNIVLEKGKIEKFIDFGDFKVFDSAGIQTMIYIMSRSDNNHIYDAKYSKVIDKKIKHKDAQAFLIGLQDKRFEYFYMTLEKANLLDKPISFINFQVQKVIKIIQLKRNFSLKDNEVGQGIVGAPDKAFIVSVDEYKKFNDIEKKYLKTFYTNAGRYYPNSTDKYIFYLSEKSFSGDISEYENILEHFSKYKDDLIRAKIQYKSPDKKYYFLHRERDDKFFKVGPKIICASRTEKPACTYTDDEFYGSRALNFIKTGNIDLKFLSTILNSGLSDFWLRNMGKMTGELLQIDKGQLLSIPLYKPQKLDQKPFIKKADIMLELNKKFHEQSSQFLQRMMDNYDLEKPNKKLQKFWELDFGEFVSEMRKKSANVPLSTQDELQDYFEKNKSELLELDNHITTTDREIDAMVYELYGLNDDEIKIIENS